MEKNYSEVDTYVVLNNIIISIIKESTNLICGDLCNNQNIIEFKDIVLDIIKLSNYLQDLFKDDYIQKEINVDRNIFVGIDVNPLASKLLFNKINSRLDELLELNSYSIVAYEMVFEKKLFLEKVFNNMNNKVKVKYIII